MATLRSERDEREYDAVRCRRCDLLFAHPIPELGFETLQEVYNGWYADVQREGSGTDAGLQVLRDATARQMELVERHVRPGLALNVGATNRAMDILLSRGWKLRFVEVSEYAAGAARAQWGFEVTVSRFEDYSAEPGSFDFVKFGHVIEHFVDPAGATRHAARLLRPGGVLLVDTDNADGLKTRVELGIRGLLGEELAASVVKRLTHKNLHKRYGRLTPPEHLYTFSERNMSRLLESAGLEVLEVFKPAWGDPTWFPMPDLRRYSAAEKLFFNVDRIGARLGMGDVIAVLARKRA
jgi:SAM-dependent methyltransferase